MNKESAPIGKCCKCGADLYATLGLCSSCELVECQGENKQLKEVFNKLIGHYKSIGFNDTAEFIEQFLKAQFGII